MDLLGVASPYYPLSEDTMQGHRQDFAWVGASAGNMSVWGGGGDPGGIICPWEILKNQVVEVHFSCILRVILTLPLRLSRPLRSVIASSWLRPCTFCQALFNVRYVNIGCLAAVYTARSK